MRALSILFGLAAGAACGWAYVGALSGWLLEPDYRSEIPPCFEVGEPFHHRFRPSCSGTMRSPRGPVLLKTNEDGLREILRSRVLSHSPRVLLLGDSFVEGWLVPTDQAPAALLTQRFPPAYFVNGGLRSTGPLQQAARLPALLHAYRPQGVVWLLNDTDVLDDRFACSVARNPAAPAESIEFSAPEFGLHGWRAAAAGLLGDNFLSAKLRRQAYRQRWTELANSDASRRCEACRGVQEVKRLAAEAGLPLLAFYLPLESMPGAAHYEGATANRQALLDCLKSAGIPAHEVGRPPEMPPGDFQGYLWENDFHFNPEGNAMLAARMETALAGWVQKLVAGAGEKKGAARGRNR